MVLIAVGADVVERSAFPVKAFATPPLVLPVGIDTVELTLIEFVPGLLAIAPVSVPHQLLSAGVIPPYQCGTTPANSTFG